MKAKIFFTIFLVNCFALLFAEEWQRISNTDFVIHCQPKQREFAQEISIQLQERIDNFQKKLGVYAHKRVKIYIAKDSNQYQEWINTRTKIVEHSSAFYSTKTRAIYIRPLSDGKIFEKRFTILLHEYIHFFVHLHWDNPLLWFNEGMAVFFSEGISFRREIGLVRDQFLNIALPLKKIYTYPDKRIYWEAMYAKSAKGLEFLFKKETDNFYRLWDYSKKTRDFRYCFKKAFRDTPENFSNRFEEKIESSTKTKALLLSLAFTWSILPFLVLIVWLIKKIKNYYIVKSWEDEEC